MSASTPHSIAIPPPGPLQLTATGWQDFNFKWTNYELATGLADEADGKRVATLLSVVGDDAIRIYRTFQFADKGDATKLDKVLEKFSNYCTPCKNVVFDRYEFLSRKKEPGESAAQYVASLRELSKSCEYEEMTPDTIVDQLIRDKLIFSVSSSIRNSLRREKHEDLTLNKVLRIIQGFEKASEEEKTYTNTTSATNPISAVRHGTCQNRSYASSHPPNRPAGNSRASNSYAKACGYCGGHAHRRDECPAKDAHCRKCTKKGHYAKVCRAPDRKGHNTSVVKTDATSDGWIISSVNSIKRRSGIVKRYRLRNHNVDFLVDTGSDVNTLPLWIYKRITQDYSLQQLQSTSQRVSCYNNSSIPCCGVTDLELTDNEGSHLLPFLILDHQQIDPLIGVKSSLDLGLLTAKNSSFSSDYRVNVSAVNGVDISTVLSLRNAYPDVFSDKVGDVGITHHINIDPNVPPVQHAQRRIQQPLLEPVKEKLDSLARQGLITPVSQPTSWVNSFVPVLKKNREIRICIDPKDLNLAIRREHYTIPVLSELTPQLKGAKFFSKFDVKHGFLHIKLDEESSLLTTFNSPFGRYRWNRLPFGLKSSPEVFQKCMHQLLEGLQGTTVIADDVLVFADTTEEHDNRVRAFLDRCREKDLHLNFNKVELRQTKVRYMGHILSD